MSYIKTSFYMGSYDWTGRVKNKELTEGFEKPVSEIPAEDPVSKEFVAEPASEVSIVEPINEIPVTKPTKSTELAERKSEDVVLAENIAKELMEDDIYRFKRRREKFSLDDLVFKLNRKYPDKNYKKMIDQRGSNYVGNIAEALGRYYNIYFDDRESSRARNRKRRKR